MTKMTAENQRITSHVEALLFIEHPQMLTVGALTAKLKNLGVTRTVAMPCLCGNARALANARGHVHHTAVPADFDTWEVDVQGTQLNPILNRLHRKGLVEKWHDPMKRPREWRLDPSHWLLQTMSVRQPAPLPALPVPTPVVEELRARPRTEEALVNIRRSARARSQENSCWDYETLTPLEEIPAPAPGAFAMVADANVFRGRLLEIVRRYGPISTSDVARKESGDHRAHKNYARAYSGLQVLQRLGHIWTDPTRPWEMVPDMKDRDAIEAWLSS